MRTLEAIELEGVVTYERARLPLNKKGLTVIYGHNKDASEDNLKSNGAGKSLLITMLAETLIDQNPLLDGRQAAKDSFGKATRTAVEFDGYRLEKFLSGKTLKYDLFKNIKGEWKPTKVRTNDYVAAKMAQLFPITNAEFFSLYYIDSSRHSLLQRGTHVERLNLFSSILNLQPYDAILAEIKGRIKGLRTHDVKLSTVLDQIAIHEKDITEDLDADVEELEALQARQKKLSAKRSELSVLIQAATVYDAHFPTLTRLKQGWANMEDKFGMKQAADWSDPDFLDEYCDALKEGMNKLKKVIKKLSEYEGQKAQLDVQKSIVEKSKKALGASTQKVDIASLKEALEQAQEFEKEVTGLEREIERATKTLSAIEVDVKQGKQLELKLTTFFGPEKDFHAVASEKLAVAQSKLTELKQEESEFKAAFGDGTEECPTCRAQMSTKTVNALMKRFVSDIDQGNIEVTELKDMKASAKEWQSIRLDKDRSDKLKTEITDLRDKLESLHSNNEAYADCTASAATISEWIVHARALKVAEQQVLDLEAVMDGLDGDGDIDHHREQFAKYSSLYEIGESFKRYRQALFAAIEKGAGEYDLTELEGKQAELDKILSGLMQKIPKLSQSVSVARSAMTKLKQLNESREELEEQLLDMPVLKALEETYGQKGLKNLRIQAACSTVESNLNVYSNLLLSEPTVFSVTADETHCHIEATRKLNGEMKTTDVRRLSGAESAAFNALVPLVMLPLVPDGRRLNVLALDEPLAHMDPLAAQMFLTKYLPIILQMVPHVIILSPTPMEIDIDHDCWKVTREHGVSTLEQIA